MGIIGSHRDSVVTLPENPSQMLFKINSRALRFPQWIRAKRKSPRDFDSYFDSFLLSRDIGDGRRRHYEVLRRMIHRYESFCRLSHRQKSCRFNIRSADRAFIESFSDYVRNEYLYVAEYPEILKENPEQRKIVPRGKTYLNALLKQLRAFFRWARESRIVEVSPFEGFKMPSEQYGTPVFLSIDEVLRIYHADLSEEHRLSVQKDIFVFQCNVGCRVGDLVRLKKSDVVNGSLEYIPTKTIKENTRTVVVPLNRVAREIVQRYSSYPGDRLLPFVSPAIYNRYIKKLLKVSGVTYLVTRLDTLSRTERKQPFNEVASSHLARRTFIGNLYRQVRDPDLISEMTGHVVGSQAFTRYRGIDVQMKRELVAILDEK